MYIDLFADAIVLPVFLSLIHILESQYKTFVEGIDSGAKALFDKDRAAAIEFLTDFSCNTGNHLVDTWRDFYG